MDFTFIHTQLVFYEGTMKQTISILLQLVNWSVRRKSKMQNIGLLVEEVKSPSIFEHLDWRKRKQFQITLQCTISSHKLKTGGGGGGGYIGITFSSVHISCI